MTGAIPLFIYLLVYSWVMKMDGLNLSLGFSGFAIIEISDISVTLKIKAQRN